MHLPEQIAIIASRIAQRKNINTLLIRVLAPLLELLARSVLAGIGVAAEDGVFGAGAEILVIVLSADFDVALCDGLSGRGGGEGGQDGGNEGGGLEKHFGD